MCRKILFSFAVESRTSARCKEVSSQWTGIDLFLVRTPRISHRVLDQFLSVEEISLVPGRIHSRLDFGATAMTRTASKYPLPKPPYIAAASFGLRRSISIISYRQFRRLVLQTPSKWPLHQNYALQTSPQWTKQLHNNC